MDDNCYTVKLHYDPDHKEIHDKVVARLSRLDPKATEKFENTKLTGQVIVKRSTDLATARRLRHLLRDTGAQCSVQKLPLKTPPAIEKNPESADRLPAAQTETNPLLIRCPNCGCQQPPVLECRACRIIISKARPRRVPEQIEAPTDAKHLPHHLTQSQLLNWVRHYARPLVVLMRRIQHPIGAQQLSSWAQRVGDRLIRCAIVFIIALFLEVGLLSLGKMMWFLYVSTVTGQYYLENFPEEAAAIQCITHVDPLSLGWDTTLTVLLAGLIVGCAAQVLHLIRYLYESQGLIGKLTLWVVPSVALTAGIISQRHPYPEYALAIMLVAVPTLCMLSSCLHLTQTMLPELGDFRRIFAITIKNREKTRGAIIKKIRIWFDTTK